MPGADSGSNNGQRKRRSRDPETVGERRVDATDVAEPGIDVEALSIINLAGSFLWPVWARAHSQGDDERISLAHRFAQETLRLSMYGSLNAARFPAIAARLEADPSA